MDLYQHFSHQLQAHDTKDLVLAFSGGVDSRVLLHLLAQYRDQYAVNVRAVHVHHGLSRNADHWVEQCRTWCHQNHILFDVEYVTLDRNSGESLEKLARDERYRVLAQYVNQQDTLLLGHHADDQLETFLLALKRGSGPKGLSAMAACASFSQGQLLRPLLTVTRQQIEQFAECHQLLSISDESNADLRYDRNFLRHQVAPILTQRWSSFRQAVQRSAELCAEQETLIEELLAEKLAKMINSDGALSIQGLKECSDAMRRQLIRAWLTQQQRALPSRQHTEMIWSQVALAEAGANPILHLKAYDIRRFNDLLFCVNSVADISEWQQKIRLDTPLILPDRLGELTLSLNRQGNIRLPDEPEALQVVFDPTGLSACPVGRAGSRKLKKLFQEYAIPSWQRRRMPILLEHNRVVAIADLFVDRDFVGQECQLIWDKSPMISLHRNEPKQSNA
ncbi:tRNA lysidine(34) synthetase TilS [Vibrio injensis]|uniref:tRNA lysidine(34) synthetase TilS n=1 Tax=Vibrio injensis TaxID=1307414 RepID=UPI000932A86C|nr:tRNA lysidine(34) synthetase TilS [Vibrio injensis]